ncbi:hypothetical protein GCM10010210_52280 [Pseudonocardia hydrocarbonoxydans]
MRTFTDADRAPLREVFRRAGEGAATLPFGGHEESIWLIPYMDGEPQSLFVATVDGEIVGYLTGCVDSARMPSEEERIYRLVAEQRLYLRPATLRFFARSLSDTVRAGRGRSASTFADPAWPAHLHIRLVPRVRGHGLGSQLMNRWLDRLRELDSPGCHLQTEAENTGALTFFERHGFLRHGDPVLIPGMRGSAGERLHQQTMVWRCR